MKLLIAAGSATESAKAVPESIRGMIQEAGEILVIAPTLPSRFAWLASATDKARQQADGRLRRVLGQLDDMGASAQGSVGADDPMQAFDDAVAEFKPDHVLIALRDATRADWQERDLIGGLVGRFSLPVTVFVVPA
jgi:hypothetical protein